MMTSVLRKECLLLWRDGRAKTGFILIVLLALAATVSGWRSVSTLELERSAAVSMDREIWNQQGEKNPHTAAHFARYAFKPTFNLAVFDPGLTDFMGNAIWLEAHYRDPAALRPVEDAIEIQRMADLTPAWVIQVFAPALIVVLLHGSIAGERETGTLKLLLSAGARPGALLLGKAIPALAIVAGLVTLILLGVLALVELGGYRITELPDTAARVISIAIAYAVYTAVFVLIALAVSALTARSRTALSLLIGVWLVFAVLVPRIGTNIGAGLSPAPPVPEFAARLSSESSDPFWGSSDEAQALRQKITDDLLAEYGVETVEDLPINFDGYLLQASEEYANVVFDSLYAELWGGYFKQRWITRYFSVISPTIALQNISMALSGTDLFAHQHHAEAAESFRREFVRMLNQDMIDHGGADGYAYLAGSEVWEQTPDFVYASPSFLQSARGVWLDGCILLAWLVSALQLLKFALHRGVLREISK